MVVFGQKWVRSGCIRATGKVVIEQKLLYSLGKSGCIRAKWLHSSKSGCIRQSCCIRGKSCCKAKVVVFGQKQKWLYSGISGCIGQNGQK